MRGKHKWISAYSYTSLLFYFSTLLLFYCSLLFVYLRDLLTKLPTHPKSRISRLSTQKWASARQAEAASEPRAPKWNGFRRTLSKIAPCWSQITQQNSGGPK